jgi:predicted RecA/RadA family phage recombinase
MKNFIQPGEVLTVVAAAVIGSGDIVKTGLLIGVAGSDAAIGESVSVNLCGVYDLPKVGATAFTQGEILYFDESESHVTNVATANEVIGYAWDAAGSADATTGVLLSRA